MEKVDTLTNNSPSCLAFMPYWINISWRGLRKALICDYLKWPHSLEIKCWAKYDKHYVRTYSSLFVLVSLNSPKRFKGFRFCTKTSVNYKIQDLTFQQRTLNLLCSLSKATFKRRMTPLSESPADNRTQEGRALTGERQLNFQNKSVFSLSTHTHAHIYICAYSNCHIAFK